MAIIQRAPKSKAMSVQEVTELMSHIVTPLSLYLMPLNYAEERSKFLNDPIYNPIFKYRTPRNENAAVFAKLKDVTEISGVEPLVSKYIIATIQSKQQASALLNSIGKDDDFVRISKERFGTPSYWLFARACKFIRKSFGEIAFAQEDEKLKEKKLHFDELEPIFQNIFRTFGLEGWTLDRSKAIATSGFRTAVKTKRIMVDPNVEISAEKLRKTIVHEVLTHALRASNGFATGFDVFGKPNIAEYLDDEEGLAMYNEEKFGVLRPKDVRRRAAIVYAIYLAQSMSFRQVFNALRAVYPKFNAFDVTFRVKRGMSDTSKSGGYNKDASYLRGYLKLRKELSKDALSYKYLYAGKIPLKYLDLVEEGVISKPKVVPTKEIVEKIFKENGLA